MRAAWLIALNDLRQNVRSKSIFVIGFVAPLTLAFILNLVFGDFEEPDGGLTFDMGLAVVDDGPTGEGFALVVEELSAGGLVEVTRFADADAARAAVDDGEVSAAWILPAGLSEAVQGGAPAELTVVGDVDAQTTASVARAVADGYASSVETGRLAGLVAFDAGVAGLDEIGAVAQEISQAPSLATLAPIDAETDELDSATEMMAGMAVFFMLFTAGMPVLSILGERQQGTLARLLAAPIPAAAVSAGKTIAGMIVSVISLVALMLSSTIVMDTDWGPPLGALLLAVCAVVAATGVMSIAGATARTAEQAGAAQSVVAVSIGFLGGTFVPLPGADDGLLSLLERLTPNKWFISGLEAITDGGAADAFPAAAALLVMGAATGAVGLLLARSALRR